jgi:preprotein translocase SecE subunit
MKNFKESLTTYLQSVRAETRKISWLARQALKQLTVFVIVLIILFSLFTGLADMLFSRLVQVILQ